MESKNVLAQGMYIKRNENAPDFVICGVSIKVSEFAKFVKEHAKDDYLNIDILRSKEGRLYAAKNTFEPKKQDAKEEPSDNLPF